MADNETIADIRKDAEAKFRELVEAYMQRRSTFQTTVGAMQAFNNVFDRIEAAHKRERGDCAKLLKTVDTRFDICKDIALVLKIGRDYQNKDGYRGAHYDTVKLLCDAIEYQQEQLKAKTEVGDVAKLREAVELCVKGMCGFCRMDAEARGMTTKCVHGCEALLKAKAALAEAEKEGVAK